MAIGIRRDRTGVMPGTINLTALVADAFVVGQVVTLNPSDGQLVKLPGIADSGVSTPQYLIVSVGESGVTRNSTDTVFDCAVIPLTDNLTYITDAYQFAASDSSYGPNPGVVGRLNIINEIASISGDGPDGSLIIVDSDADHNTDVRILKTLEDGTASGVAAVVEFEFINA